MRDAMSAIAGEAAKLRSEANHLLTTLDWLDTLANHRSGMPAEGHSMIYDLLGRYGGTVSSHLEYASDATKELYRAVEELQKRTSW